MRTFSSKVEEHYEFVTKKGKEQGYSVIATCLIGSQNYGLDTPDSDVDTISIVVPNFEAICCGRPKIDHTYDFEDGGKAKVRDYRSFALNDLKKSCFTNTEVLYSVKVVVNPTFSQVWNFLMENREIIMRADYEATVRSMLGYVSSMESRFQKKGFSGYREDLGMNPKMFMHAVRAYDWLGKFIPNKVPTKELFDARDLSDFRLTSIDSFLYKYNLKCLSTGREVLNGYLEKKLYPPKDPRAEEILKQFCVMAVEALIRGEE
jgi:hypothetical protein